MKRGHRRFALIAALALGCGGGDGDSEGGVDGGPGGDGSSDADGAGGDSGGLAIDARQVAHLDLTFAGTCAPSFDDQDVVVVSNADSVAISTTQAAGFSSIQFDLKQSSGTIALSTQQRVQNGDVINVVSQSTTWTNISNDTIDPIDGVLTIHTYQEQAGILDLEFDGVVLQNVGDDSLCTVNGTLVTTGTSF